MKDLGPGGHFQEVSDNHPSQHGDAATQRFEAIFNVCHPRVLAYARRRTDDGALAEEVVSETFLIAWRRFADLPTEPLPWLLGTARKVLANQRRGADRRAPDGPTIPIEQVGDADSVQPIPDRLAERQAFATAFAALRPADREVLALVAWDGLEPREAGPVLGCTAATFSLRLYRARRRLLKELAASGHSFGVREDKKTLKIRPETKGAA